MPQSKLEVPADIGGDAALGKVAAVQDVLLHLPALDLITVPEAERVYASAAQAGPIEIGSYAHLAIAAAPQNESTRKAKAQGDAWYHEQQRLDPHNLAIPDIIGGTAAAASAAARGACLEVLPPPEDLSVDQAKHLESAAMKAAGGEVESGSYAALAVAAMQRKLRGAAEHQ